MIRGKGLGGSSQINFQVWSLGARDEFDAWAERTKANEWGFEYVLSTVKKVYCFLNQPWQELNFRRLKMPP